MMQKIFGALVLACVLASCGGSDDPPAPPVTQPDPPPPTSADISGIAAKGIPFANATITLYDRSGVAVASTSAHADGSYSLTIPATTQAPLVVEAVKDGEIYVSTFGETKTTRLNITPLTNLVAARLAPDGNPLKLRADPSKVTPANLAAQVAELMTLLKPLTDSVSATIDPLTGTFAADGTAHDMVLDLVNVSIRDAGDHSNIEISLRAATADAVFRPFTSNGAMPAPLPAVAAQDLPPANVAQKLEALMARMTACYALPLEQRVSTATSATQNATGTASDVIAADCRGLFVGNDPAVFLNNGAKVGRDANGNGSFTGIFRRAATGAKFDNVQLEYIRDNPEKDVVFSYRATDSAGNVSFDTLVARSDGDGLRMIGNQYAYNARVRPWVVNREFLNQPAASYSAVGYNVNITNAQKNGVLLFAKVQVTAPNGEVFVYRPQAGRSELSAEKADGTLSNASTLMLSYKMATSGSATPDSYDGFRWASPPYSDEQLRQLPEQGVWQLEFFHADTSKANVIQRYRTLSRAPTLAEAALMPMADLTAAAKTQLRAASQANGLMATPTDSSTVNLSIIGGGDFWAVPEGAFAPTSISIYGRGPDPDGSGPLRGANFDDRVTVAPSARTAAIGCTRLSTGDTHCASSGQFAAGSTVNTLELWVLAPRGVEISRSPALWYPLPR